MEHISMQKQKRKYSQWDLELYRLKQSNARRDRVNQALTVAIYFLSFSAAVGFIMKFIG